MHSNHPKAGGSFGDVWQGTVEGQDVAIKTPRIFTEEGTDKILKEFSAEIIIWRQLFHPNVLPFYGIFYFEERRSQIGLVSAWMEDGNIMEFLQKNPSSERMPLVIRTTIRCL